MLVRKHLIGPGRYWHMNRDTGMQACMDATPERIRKWFDNGNAMLSAGLSIPVPLEHQPDARPLSKMERQANLLKNNTGYVKSFEMDGDNLFSILDIQDESIIPKLPRTIRWTSPWITSFMDGSGKVWDEAIGHVALTSHPVITKQQPFPTVQAAMSYATSLKKLPVGLPKDGVYLSRAGLLQKAKGGIFEPVYPMAFSFWTGGIMLAEDEMAPPKKEEKKPEGKKPESKGPPKEGEKPESEKPEGEGDAPEVPQLGPDGQPMPEALVDPDGDIAVEEVICDLLALVGINVPEGCTPENFREHLYRALMDHHKAEAGMMQPTDAEMSKPTNQPNQPPMNQLPKNPPTAPVVQESQPMYMSIEQIKTEIGKVTDPTMKTMLSAMLSMQETSIAQAEALKKHAFEKAKYDRDQRIKAIKLRYKDATNIAAKLAALETGAQFSMDANGFVLDSMAPTLDILETALLEAPPIPAVLSSLMSMGGLNKSIVEQSHPADMTDGPGKPTKERIKAASDEFLKNTGLADEAA